MCTRGRERQAVNRSQIAFGARSCSINRRRIAQRYRKLLCPSRARAHACVRCVRMESGGFCKTSHMAIPRAPGPAYEPTVDGLYPAVSTAGFRPRFAPVRAAAPRRGTGRTFSPPTLPYSSSRLLQMQLKTPRDRTVPAHRPLPVRGFYNVAMMLHGSTDTCTTHTRTVVSQRLPSVIKRTMDITFERPMIPRLGGYYLLLFFFSKLAPYAKVVTGTAR